MHVQVGPGWLFRTPAPVVAVCGSCRCSAFAFDAVGVSVLFAGYLGAVPDQETGVAGEFVLLLGNDMHREFLGDKLASRDDAFIHQIGFVKVFDDAACVRGAGGLQRFQGAVLGLLDVWSYFVVIGCRRDWVPFLVAAVWH